MRLRELTEGVGRIVKGVNTTADVGPDEIKKQAAKMGFNVDKDGRPPTLSKKVKGKSTNVLYNLGLAESKSYSCPRTRASSCQCESVNKVTESEETVTAVCVLEHSDKVKGTLLLKQTANGPTLIVGEITGLEPGEHGFHIHEFGDMSKGCESMGGHYNPDGVDHGDLDEGHVGDLGNITADRSGTAIIKIVAKRVDLIGERSVVGRGIVVHKDEDDLGKGGDAESLKTGNAGDRLACGVILLKENVSEGWSEKYKKSIDCSNPKGFSQKAHCAGRKKNEDIDEGLEDAVKAAQLLKKALQSGREQDIFAAIKFGWGYIKNPTLRKLIVSVVKKLAQSQGMDWDEAVAYIKKNTGIDVTNVNENFADGKVKGKSRPGRVKRAGASCNGSVTSLRKKAKKYSGERGKMYHWCANMKAGKKK